MFLSASRGPQHFCNRVPVTGWQSWCNAAKLGDVIIYYCLCWFSAMHWPSYFYPEAKYNTRTSDFPRCFTIFI